MYLYLCQFVPKFANSIYRTKQTYKFPTYIHTTYIHTYMLIFSQNIPAQGVLRVYNSSVWGPLSVPMPVPNVHVHVPRAPSSSSSIMVSPQDISYLLRDTEQQPAPRNTIIALPRTVPTSVPTTTAARALFSSFGMMTRVAPSISGSCGCGMRG